MLFQSVSLLLSATCVLATPLTQDHSVPNSYTELHREPVAHGSLVYRGLAPGTEPKTSAVQERDGYTDSKLDCSTEPTFAPRNDLCDKLVESLAVLGGFDVNLSPREICFEGEDAEKGSECCVSWHEGVPNLIQGDLIAIVKNLQTCTSKGQSGKTYGTLVHQTCTDVCLSNRGKGC
jgi:hypothetical protein